MSLSVTLTKDSTTVDLLAGDYSLMDEHDFGGVSREWESAFSPTNDLPYLGPSSTSAPRLVQVTVHVSGSDADDCASNVSDLLAVLPDDATYSTLAVTPNGSTNVASLIARRIVGPVDKPMIAEEELNYNTVVTFTLACDPYVYGDTQSLVAPTDCGLLNPTGSTWPGSYGRSVANTNYLPNPSMQLYTGSLATGYSQTAGAAAYTNSAVLSSMSALKQRVQYTGAAGDVNATIYPLKTPNTAAGSFAEGDPVAFSGWVHGSSAGVTITAYVQFRDEAGSIIASSATATGITLTESFARFEHAAGTCPAGTSRVSALIKVANVHSGDTLDLNVDCLQIEKQASPSVYFDGSASGDFAYWDGTANASVSYRWGIAAESGRFRIVTSGDDGPEGSSPEFAVVGGETYGAALHMQLTSFTSGAAEARIKWYTAAHVYISHSDVRRRAAADSAEVYGYANVTAPATAAYARFSMAADAGSVLNCNFCDAAFGADVQAAPCVYELPKHGDLPAPLVVVVDADLLELNALFAGVYSDSSATIDDFAITANSLTWSTDSKTTDTAGYPDGVGNTLQRNQSATEVYADIDVTDFALGEYLLLAKCKATSANAGTIRHAFQSAVSIPFTTLQLLPLGVVTLPCSAVRAAATSTLRVYLAGDGTNYGYANAFFFVPVSRSGLLGWHKLGGHAHVLRWEDGALYADDVGDLGNAYGDRQLLTRGGLLVVVAEQATPQPTTGLVAAVTQTPRFEHFPSA